MPDRLNLLLLQEPDFRGMGVEQAAGLDYTTLWGVTEPPPDPVLTGRVYLNPGTPGGEGEDPVGQSWCLQVRGRPLRSLGGGTGPASSQGSGLEPDSAEFLSLASRVFLGWGNLPAVTYARGLLSNFLLLHCELPGRAGLAALLPCGGGSAPFPLGSYPS